MANGKPIQLIRYESRFKQSLLPDIVHLKAKNYDLQIPEKWKGLRAHKGLTHREHDKPSSLHVAS
jgi:hypothetical protein